jgi:hypothetical protein
MNIIRGLAYHAYTTLHGLNFFFEKYFIILSLQLLLNPLWGGLIDYLPFYVPLKNFLVQLS